jgi:hypothetical protein
MGPHMGRLISSHYLPHQTNDVMDSGYIPTQAVQVGCVTSSLCIVLDIRMSLFRRREA